jgi:hypothetical protein
MLGGVRQRPKANKPSITNASSMPGGLFGRQPSTYGQVVEQEPAQYRMAPSAGDGLDFLTRVEQTEARDSRRIGGAGPSSIVFGDDSTSYDVSRQNRQVTQQRRQQQWQGGIVFGDDSTVASKQRPGSSMYETTNASNQAKMQQQHRAALKKQEEQVLVDIMVEQHGMSVDEARRELTLYRDEQAAGLVDDASAFEQVQRNAEREQQQKTTFEPWDVQDPFKQRSPTYSAPKGNKPWDVNDTFKQGHDRSPPRPKSKPWDIDDPFKQRSSTTPSKGRQAAWDVVDPLRGSHQSPPARVEPNDMRAAGSMGDGASPAMPRRGHNHQWNANRPSMEGGLFSQDAY